MAGQQQTGGKTKRPKQTLPPVAALDPVVAAKRAQLRYVSDATPRITCEERLRLPAAGWRAGA